METYGILSLIPTIAVVTTAIVTHRPIISLIVGVVVGIAMIDPSNIIGTISEINLSVLQDETIGWIIMVCGLMGGLIYLLIQTGGATAFANKVAQKANTRNKSLIATWMLGIFLFIDDYLNAIAIGSAMKQVTDRFKVSRAMLSYVVDSTAAPTCVLVPISTWAVFFAGVLESAKVAGTGEGMSMYISGIPYMFYPFVAVLIVPLVATGKIPLVGLMKRAEISAQRGIVALTPVETIEEAEASVTDYARENTNMWMFLIPLFCLIGFSVYFDIDLLKGVMATLLVCIPLFIVKKLLTLHQAFDGVMNGFKIMLPPLAIVVAAFMFKDVNDQLGLPKYVIETLAPLMSPAFLPLVTFWSMAFVSFATGSSWGVFAIAIPIIMPLGAAIGAPTPLVIGALLSASSFGSHACFYGDATVLSAQSSGLSVMEHALSQLPYALLAALIASIIFIGFGLFAY